jgi:hypothetical protein
MNSSFAPQPLYVLMNRDMELACDEKVIRLLGENVRSTYALCLIRMAEQRGYHAPLYNGFSKNAAEERIVSIMKFKKATIFTTLTAFLLLVGVTSAFATTAKEPKPVDLSATTKLSAEVDDRGNLVLKNGEKVLLKNGQKLRGIDLQEFKGSETPLKDSDSNVIGHVKIDDRGISIERIDVKGGKPPALRGIGVTSTVEVAVTSDADGKITITDNNGHKIITTREEIRAKHGTLSLTDEQGNELAKVSLDETGDAIHAEGTDPR